MRRRDDNDNSGACNNDDDDDDYDDECCYLVQVSPDDPQGTFSTVTENGGSTCLDLTSTY